MTKPFDVCDIAAGIQQHIINYVVEPMTDMLSESIRTAVEKTLDKENIHNVIILASNPAQRMLTQSRDYEKLYYRVGDTHMELKRVVSPTHSQDITTIRVNSDAFINEVLDDAVDIVDEIITATDNAKNLVGLSIPKLWIEVKAYTVTWMLWGHYGVKV